MLSDELWSRETNVFIRNCFRGQSSMVISTFAEQVTLGYGLQKIPPSPDLYLY